MSVDRLAEAPPLLVFMARWHQVAIGACSVAAVVAAAVTTAVWGLSLLSFVPVYLAEVAGILWWVWRPKGRERRRYESLRRGEPMPPSFSTAFPPKAVLSLNVISAAMFVGLVVLIVAGSGWSLADLAFPLAFLVFLAVTTIGVMLPNSRTRADEDERRRRAQLPPPPSASPPSASPPSAMTLGPPAPGR